MKHTKPTIIILIICTVLTCGCIQNNTDNLSDNDVNPIAIIATSEGTIEVELFKDMVPITVNNFINYSNSGFYNGLIFHRVIDDFLVQSGGYYPNGTKREVLYDPIIPEIHPDLRHVDGAIGMIITFDTVFSEFYICDGDQPDLDDVNPVIGVVINGMDVVREISSVETTTYLGRNDWPIETVMINDITIQD